METPAARWPTREAYDAAMLHWQQTLSDPQLRAGQLARVRDSESIARYGGAGLYVCVYRIGDYLVRCFRANPPKEPPADIAERYAVISAFIAQHAAHVPALIPIDYQASGIRVDERMYPIVKMPFLRDALPLGRYLAKYHQDQTATALLAEAWLGLLKTLEAVPMAHGDLDLTNVLVQTRDGQPHLRLIDYDNLWIPPLAGRHQTENGHEHFQHPAFLPPNERPYTAEMDRFAALVIYLSLLALNQQPQVYDDWEADESSFLLLLRSDYQQIAPLSPRLAYLRAMPGLAPYVDALVASLAEQRMPAPVTALTRDFPIPLIAPHRLVPLAPVGHRPRPQVDLRPRVMAFPDAPPPAIRTPSPAQPASHPPPHLGTGIAPLPPSSRNQAPHRPSAMRKAPSLPELPIHAGGPTPHTPLYAISDMTPPPPDARPLFAGTISLPVALRRIGLIALITLILVLALAISLRH